MLEPESSRDVVLALPVFPEGFSVRRVAIARDLVQSSLFGGARLCVPVRLWHLFLVYEFLDENGFFGVGPAEHGLLDFLVVLHEQNLRLPPHVPLLSRVRAPPLLVGSAIIFGDFHELPFVHVSEGHDRCNVGLEPGNGRHGRQEIPLVFLELDLDVEHHHEFERAQKDFLFLGAEQLDVDVADLRVDHLVDPLDHVVLHKVLHPHQASPLQLESFVALFRVEQLLEGVVILFGGQSQLSVVAGELDSSLALDFVSAESFEGH